jgi:type I restriction enzyme S subunit
MKEWPLVQLRRIASLAYGDSLAADDRADGSVPVYGSNGKIGEHDTPNTNGPAVIIGRKGSFGKVQYSAVPTFAIDTTFYIDEAHSSADLRWLFYALTTLDLDKLSEDVGVPGLSRDSAYAQRLPLPPPREQRAIAGYLDAKTSRIDALIAKKQRQIVLLSEHRQALITAAVSGELDISSAPA